MYSHTELCVCVFCEQSIDFSTIPTKTKIKYIAAYTPDT